MQDDSSVILFASNVASTSPRSTRFKLFYKRILKQLTESKSQRIIKLVSAYSNAEILKQLHDYENQIVALHFEGRSEHFRALQSSYQENNIGDLSTYLGSLKELRFVFLSGCATDEYIQELLDSGVQVVVTSSHRLSVDQIEQFAETVYSELLVGTALQGAYEKSKQKLNFGEGNVQRIFVNIRGIPKARMFRFIKSRIVGTSSDSKAVDKQDDQNSYTARNKLIPTEQPADGAPVSDDVAETEESPKPTITDRADPPAPGSPPPDQPPQSDQSATSGDSSGPKKRQRPPRNYTRGTSYIGNHPFTPDDADIFFGRDAEIDALVDFVKDPGKPPFAVLSGAAGCGKTSLIQAGLLPNLDKSYEVIQLSAQATPDLVAELHTKLWELTKQDNLLHGWQTIEGNFGKQELASDRQIVLILDQIEGLINSPQPRVRGELRRFLVALIPVYAHTLFRSQSKVIFSVRPLEARDLRDSLLEVAFPTFHMPLPVISAAGLKEAIEMPFRDPLPSHLRLNNDVAKQMLDDLGKDPTSVQLPFLQAMVESLWTEVQKQHGVGSPISMSDYSTHYKSCKLFEPFLDTQMQKVIDQLGGRIDTYTLLKILWLHSSPHHLSTQQAMRERQQLFSHIAPHSMAEIVDTLCNHYLLIAVPANKPATVQIAHRELSPLVSKRLIELGRSPISWWQSLQMRIQQADDRLLARWREWRSKPPSSTIGTIPPTHFSGTWSDTTIIVTLLALIGVSIIAGLLLTQLIDS